MKAIFEIHYEDLTEVAQHYLCKAFETTPEEENWNSFPITVIERELEEKVVEQPVTLGKLLQEAILQPEKEEE